MTVIEKLMEEGSALKLRADRAERERDEALAKCAEMAALLETYGQWHPGKGRDIEHALSTDCGKGWLSPDKRNELETEIERLKHERNRIGMEERSHYLPKIKTLVEALDEIVNIVDENDKAMHALNDMVFIREIASKGIASVKGQA